MKTEHRMIRLIATDLDGTLLNSRKEVPAGFEQWVFCHPEIKMVIASGRQYYNIRKLFGKAADSLIYLAENGGMVVEKGEVVYTNTIRTEDVITCIERFQEKDGHTVILCGEQSAYMNHSSEDAERNAHMYYEKLKFTDDLRGCIEKDHIIKIAVFIGDYDADTYYRKLEKLNDRLSVVLSGTCWIDIANKEVCKGAALKFLQEKYGIGAEESMAFGDFLNDESLLEQCTESYAMRNGHPLLKEKAKYIAPSNDEDGVMSVLLGLY
ncbi:MAG: HAD family hydrolase [Lachnospiraceae bacterium]